MRAHESLRDPGSDGHPDRPDGDGDRMDALRDVRGVPGRQEPSGLAMERAPGGNLLSHHVPVLQCVMRRMKRNQERLEWIAPYTWIIWPIATGIGLVLISEGELIGIVLLALVAIASFHTKPSR